jgi:hypothetical protein
MPPSALLNATQKSLAMKFFIFPWANRAAAGSTAGLPEQHPFELLRRSDGQPTAS